MPQMTESPRSRCASPLRLHGPVVRTLLRARIATGSALLLLDVVRSTTATDAQRVRLARTLSITGCSFRLRFAIILISQGKGFKQTRGNEWHCQTSRMNFDGLDL